MKIVYDISLNDSDFEKRSYISRVLNTLQFGCFRNKSKNYC